MKNKDYFVDQTAEYLSLPRDLVNAVISFQGEDAAKAAHRCNEIEFSGLGKFILSKHRLGKYITRLSAKLEGMPPSEKKDAQVLFLQKLKQKQYEMDGISGTPAESEEPQGCTGGSSELCEDETQLTS